jgi:hypothetical protein
MFVPFETIAPSSRIWIYQSIRKFTGEEVEIITGILKTFTATWAAHGQPLQSSFDIRYDQFIILAANESFNATSGCSIDESVRVIKEIDSQIGAELFDRQYVAFKQGESVMLLHHTVLKQKYSEGIWNEATPAFNNLVSVKSQLEGDWIIPAGKSWVRRYVPGLKVAT